MGTVRRKVALLGIRFYGFHGYYPEEQIIGSEFFLDIETYCDVSGEANAQLPSTVNYERLFFIANKQMKEPRKLLETVAHAILKDVQMEFPLLPTIRVAIYKMNPSLGGEVKSSLVELIYSA